MTAFLRVEKYPPVKAVRKNHAAAGRGTGAALTKLADIPESKSLTCNPTRRSPLNRPL